MLVSANAGGRVSEDSEASTDNWDGTTTGRRISESAKHRVWLALGLGIQM